jgi:hypothetical protein
MIISRTIGTARIKMACRRLVSVKSRSVPEIASLTSLHNGPAHAVKPSVIPVIFVFRSGIAHILIEIKNAHKNECAVFVLWSRPLYQLCDKFYWKFFPNIENSPQRLLHNGSLNFFLPEPILSIYVTIAESTTVYS